MPFLINRRLLSSSLCPFPSPFSPLSLLQGHSLSFSLYPDQTIFFLLIFLAVHPSHPFKIASNKPHLLCLSSFSILITLAPLLPPLPPLPSFLSSILLHRHPHQVLFFFPSLTLHLPSYVPVPLCRSPSASLTPHTSFTITLITSSLLSFLHSSFSPSYTPHLPPSPSIPSSVFLHYHSHHIPSPIHSLTIHSHRSTLLHLHHLFLLSFSFIPHRPHALHYHPHHVPSPFPSLTLRPSLSLSLSSGLLTGRETRCPRLALCSHSEGRTNSSWHSFITQPDVT